RWIGSDCGSPARCCSSREMLSALPEIAVAHAPTDSEAAANTAKRIVRIVRSLLPVGIQHVFEAHPLGVEVQIDITRWTVSVFSNQQLRRARDVARRLIHVLPKEAEDDVGELLDRPQCPEVVEGWTTVRPFGKPGQGGRGQYGGVPVERQCLEAPNRRCH